MLTCKKILPKLEQALNQYKKLRFENVAEIAVDMAETTEHYRQEPQNDRKMKWAPMKAGKRWGGSGITAWFRGDFTMPQECQGSKVFLTFKSQQDVLIIEALLLVDGSHKGVFNEKHPFVLMTPKAKGGTKHHIAIEAYSGHNYPSTQPHDVPIVVEKNGRDFGGLFIARERDDVSAFCYDLEVILKLVKALDDNSLRKGQLIATLEKVWKTISCFPADLEESEWRPRLAAARKILAPLLARKNSETAPAISVVAHSHIDTAWLWTIAETRRKCARTFSSMANLMEQYPEVVFFQSAPCHAEFLRQDYPQIFEKVKALVKKGRWEPNGGAWIEPDCNLTSGEALVRQFLVGINWTREHFDYTPDTLWQPDVFGYSAALPQILQGCGIKYFCTTKMAWNDTNRFPYDTFTWRGIDGTSVLTHLNSLPQSIDSDDVINLWNWAQHKDSEVKRLASYGWGDGGGGPTMEDMEKIRRMENLEGLPKVSYTTVTKFMNDLEKQNTQWPTWVGELYLELHRGTTTSIGAIKRGNRKTELGLRNAELTHTLAALAGVEYPRATFLETWKELLVNQFHDILPGTSIAEVNDVALASFRELMSKTEAMTKDGLQILTGKSSTSNNYLLFNSLNWKRCGTFFIEGVYTPSNVVGSNAPTQLVSTLEGRTGLLVGGMELEGFGGHVISLEKRKGSEAPSPFKLKGNTLDTPLARIKFDKAGRITSYFIKALRREVVAKGALLNNFLLGEDVPLMWDQWDIDADQELQMQSQDALLSREVVADGQLQLRIRSAYRLGKNSTLHQDMVFHAHTLQVDFETKVEWQEKHRLLKVGFTVDILSESAKHETQYGHLDRPTHRNTSQDSARFEVCCHKWSDMSDNGFGVAILNDCKYGISVHNNEMRLSLIKSGTHPDPRGDNGTHHFTYSLLPHAGPFSVKSVVRPAYELNIPPIVQQVPAAFTGIAPLLTVDAPNVIVESIKWAEKDKAFIVRLYDAGRMAGHCSLTINLPFKKIIETNLLEEPVELQTPKNRAIEFFLRPFQIKTFKVFV